MDRIVDASMHKNEHQCSRKFAENNNLLQMH